MHTFAARRPSPPLASRKPKFVLFELFVFVFCSHRHSLNSPDSRFSFFEHELLESHEFFSVFQCFLCSFFQCRQPSPRFRPGNNIRAIRVIRGSFLSTPHSCDSCDSWFFFRSPRLTLHAKRSTFIVLSVFTDLADKSQPLLFLLACDAKLPPSKKGDF